MSKILLVEDDHLFRGLLSNVLVQRKYEIITAVNGQEAIVISKETKPDLILMDVRLPGTSGFEAIATIKATLDTAKIPIIILSASATLRDKEKGIALGCDAYLVKPFAFQELFKLLDTMLGNKSNPTA